MWEGSISSDVVKALIFSWGPSLGSLSLHLENSMALDWGRKIKPFPSYSSHRRSGESTWWSLLLLPFCIIWSLPTTHCGFLYLWVPAKSIAEAPSGTHLHSSFPSSFSVISFPLSFYLLGILPHATLCYWWSFPLSGTTMLSSFKKVGP